MLVVPPTPTPQHSSLRKKQGTHDTACCGSRFSHSSTIQNLTLRRKYPLQPQQLLQQQQQQANATETRRRQCKPSRKPHRSGLAGFDPQTRQVSPPTELQMQRHSTFSPQHPLHPRQHATERELICSPLVIYDDRVLGSYCQSHEQCRLMPNNAEWL